MSIIDYSVARPSISQLKAAGVTAVGRYIGWDGVAGHQNTGKNITHQEASELLANDISVFLVFEYNANAPAQGASQGRADGILARQQMEALGAPSEVCCYFAVDFDMPDYAPALPGTPPNSLAKLGPVGEYFAAIKKLALPFPIGVYGGYWACKRLFDADLVHYGWQTVAWSGGAVDARVSLLQEATPGPLPGTDINIRENSQRTVGFGQWTAGKVTPPPPPPPAKVTLAQADAAMKQLQNLASQAVVQAGIIEKYLSGQ